LALFVVCGEPTVAGVLAVADLSAVATSPYCCCSPCFFGLLAFASVIAISVDLDIS
jgi:hypothetical protein